MSRHGALAIGLLALVAAGLAGCDDRQSTNEDYERIKTGMSYQEVVAVLGEPDSVSGGGGEVDGIGGSGRFAVWHKDGRKITITFVNDKVTVKTIGD